jgi:hypothetical protein
MTTDPKTEAVLHRAEYFATDEELQIIDSAMASLDAGESVSAAAIKAVFAKYRRT